MTRVLTEEQAANLNIEVRERSALEELQKIGARVFLHETRRLVEPDPLLGVEGGWEPGCCHATLYATDGRQRPFANISAVAVLADVEGFIRRQANALRETRFVVSLEPTAVDVTHHVVGDTATARARRRELTFSPTGELIASHDAD